METLWNDAQRHKEMTGVSILVLPEIEEMEAIEKIVEITK